MGEPFTYMNICIYLYKCSASSVEPSEPWSFAPAGPKMLLFTALQPLWRSKWPFGLDSGPAGPKMLTSGARNGCSGLHRFHQSARNGRLSLHRCRQSARNGRSGMPLCRQSARNGRSGTVLCHTGSKIALEVAFEIAVRRICARCHETLLHYALLCMACAWICTGSH